MTGAPAPSNYSGPLFCWRIFNAPLVSSGSRRPLKDGFGSRTGNSVRRNIPGDASVVLHDALVSECRDEVLDDCLDVSCHLAAQPFRRLPGSRWAAAPRLHFLF